MRRLYGIKVAQLRLSLLACLSILSRACIPILPRMHIINKFLACEKQTVYLLDKPSDFRRLQVIKCFGVPNSGLISTRKYFILKTTN